MKLIDCSGTTKLGQFILPFAASEVTCGAASENTRLKVSTAVLATTLILGQLNHKSLTHPSTRRKDLMAVALGVGGAACMNSSNSTVQKVGMVALGASVLQSCARLVHRSKGLDSSSTVEK